MADVWVDGGAYERFMGRWSRLLAPLFVDWLARSPGLRWTDLGCGTGALSATILDRAGPSSLLGIEPSPGFLETARTSITDDRARFRLGSVEQLDPCSTDVVVAGLVLNFLPDAYAALAAMSEAARGGTVAAYVWDYDGGHPMLSRFWTVAERLAGRPVGQSELSRFPLCRPDALADLWHRSGLTGVETRPLEVEQVFDGFADYWEPFLGGQGPAPAYVAGLGEVRRRELRDALEADLLPGDDGRIRLHARAWAVRGTCAS